MANPRKLVAHVEDISIYGEHVCILRLHTEAKLPRFKPGQFLHLALDAYDPSNGFWPESRVFSIAAAPSDQDIVIAYSVKGSFTSRMKRELHVGSGVWIKLPYGSFVIDEIVGSSGPIILVAGGTGITAFVSFLDREANGCSLRQMRLFYGVKNKSLFLFQEQIANAKCSCREFSYQLYLEEAVRDGALSATLGRLKAAPIIDAHREMNSGDVFLAGPPLMIDSFQQAFTSAGVPVEKIHIDAWE